jgi:hypothetical protein
MIWVVVTGGVITGVGLLALITTIIVKMPPSKRGADSGSYHDIGYPGEGDDYGGGHHGGGH